MTKRTRASVESSPQSDEPEDALEIFDSDDLDDPGEDFKPKLVKSFIRMWPRAIFETPAQPGGHKTIASTIPELQKSGVYVLYRDDVPFYVGKTEGKLRFRLRQHAINVGSVRSYFWNYFSAYIVDKENIDEVEAIIISAMPSVLTNSSTPRFKNRVKMSESTRKLMRSLREKGFY